MQRIVCEVCSSNEFVRSEEFYICSHCSTKYLLDYVKSHLLQSGVKIDTSSEQKNLEVLLKRAYDERNMRELLDFANRLLLMDPNNFYARLYKTTSTYALEKPRMHLLQDYFQTIWRYYDEFTEQQKQEVIKYLLSECEYALPQKITNLIAHAHSQYGEANSTQRDYVQQLQHIVEAFLTLPSAFGQRGMDEKMITPLLEQNLTHITHTVTTHWLETFNRRYQGQFDMRQQSEFYYTNVPLFIRTLYTNVQSKDQQLKIATYYHLIIKALKPKFYTIQVGETAVREYVLEAFLHIPLHQQILNVYEAEERKAFAERNAAALKEVDAIYASIEDYHAKMAACSWYQTKEKKDYERIIKGLHEQANRMKAQLK